MIKRIINWKYVETAVMLVARPTDAVLRYSVRVDFNSGEWINLWYETEEQAQMFFTEMRHALDRPCPGVYIVNS